MYGERCRRFASAQADKRLRPTALAESVKRCALKQTVDR